MLENGAITLMDIYNKEQDDDSVDNLLRFIGQRLEQDETMHPKSFLHHYQPSRKRFH